MNQSINFNKFHKLLYFVAFISVLTVSLFAVSCSFKEPSAPTWDVTVAIPLINRVITVEELIEDTQYLAEGESGLVNFEFEEEFSRYEVGDQLKVADLNETFSSSLGQFKVPSPGVRAASMTFGQIYPAAYLLDGQVTQVGTFGYDNVGVSLPGFDTFVSVLIGSGRIQITISNRLPVTLSAGLEIQARSQSTNELLFNILFDSDIQPGTSAVASTDLASVRIPSDIKVFLTGGSSGSGGQPVEINANTDGIDFQVYISEIVAVEAQAIVEPQEFSGSDSLALGDSILISSASIATGLFRVDISNDIPINVDLDIFLHDFIDPVGNSAEVNINLLSNQTVSEIINLAGYTFKPGRNQDGSVTHFSWNARVLGSEGNIITVTSDDAISLSIRLANLSFSEIKGWLDKIHITLDTMEESFDLPDDIEGLQFEAGRLELVINNGIGFPIHPDIKITGVNENTGQSVDVYVSQQIAPANGGPVPTSIVLDKTNSNIIDLVNIFPNKIIVSGVATIGDGSSESVIRNTDFIETTVIISAPLSLSFPSQSVKLDVETVEIDADVQDQLRDNVLSGKLMAQISNRIPLGVDFSFVMSSRDTSVYTNPELTIGPLSLKPARIAGGNGVEAVVSDILVELTQQQIALFANDEIFIGFSLNLAGSDGEIVRIYADDFINVKAYCEFTYHVDPEEE
ncbi:hypothetical protein IIC38_13285 [candidate division KSB1 bacterium]|nr:hypothetical protein [candidate division KSB1 bacterium]